MLRRRDEPHPRIDICVIGRGIEEGDKSAQNGALCARRGEGEEGPSKFLKCEDNMAPFKEKATRRVTNSVKLPTPELNSKAPSIQNYAPNNCSISA